MKKLIMTFFGVLATSSTIRGRKSCGCEDIGSYPNFRAQDTGNQSSMANTN